MIRGKFLFISLIGIGCMAALLAIIQMWSGFLELGIFIDCMVTFVVIGSLLSFLMAVDYDFPSSKVKALLLILVLLAVSSAALILQQVWFGWLVFDIFWKVCVTLLIIAGLLAFILAAQDDFNTNKKLRDENYID